MLFKFILFHTLCTPAVTTNFFFKSGNGDQLQLPAFLDTNIDVTFPRFGYLLIFKFLQSLNIGFVISYSIYNLGNLLLVFKCSIEFFNTLVLPEKSLLNFLYIYILTHLDNRHQKDIQPYERLRTSKNLTCYCQLSI